VIFTQHNDNQRTGAYLDEKQLNIKTVNPRSFGKLFERLVDGSVYAQPLVVPNVPFGEPKNSVAHNAIFVATMHNSVFAFDADDPVQRAPLWHRHLAPSIQLPAADVGDGDDYHDILWEVGIVGTPVIDTDRGALYCVTTSRQSARGVPIHQLWKLALSTGQTIEKVVIAASYGQQVFHSYKNLQRAALLLANERVYVTFASYGDKHMPYHGWILAYDADKLVQTNVFCSTPTHQNGGIWQAGQGPAVDDEGNIYFMTGNGDVYPGDGDFGDSVVKLSPTLGVLDFFTPYNESYLDTYDLDLGSGGVLVIPNSNYCCGGGKEAMLYLLDRDALGGHDSSSDHVAQKVQVSPTSFGLAGDQHHIHGSPTIWDGPGGQTVYIWPERDYLKAYSFDGRRLSTAPVSRCTIREPDDIPGGNKGMPGGFLTVSADRDRAGTGIVWANHPWHGDPSASIGAGILRAFDAQDLRTELWNSRKSFSRDDFGNFAKFCCPTVLNGKVYMATIGGLQQKQVLTDRTMGSPQFANQNDTRLVLAWSGTDQPSHLNIMISTDGLTWPIGTKWTIPDETTHNSPGLAFDAVTDKTFIAWTGTDRHLNIRSSTAPDLRSWVNKWVTPERSHHATAIAFGAGRLFVAWTGLDDRLNVATTNDGLGHWMVKKTLEEKSYTQPWITFSNNTLLLCWQGLDQRLNFLQTTDFADLIFVNKVTIGERSDSHPAVAVAADGLPFLCWRGVGNDVLNQIVSDTGDTNGFAADPSFKRPFDRLVDGPEKSPNGPSLCPFRQPMFVAWQGTDDDHHINVAVLNRGSVAVYGLLAPRRGRQ